MQKTPQMAAFQPRVNFTIINCENGKNQLFSRFLQYIFSAAQKDRNDGGDGGK